MVKPQQHAQYLDSMTTQTYLPEYVCAQHSIAQLLQQSQPNTWRQLPVPLTALSILPCCPRGTCLSLAVVEPLAYDLSCCAGYIWFGRFIQEALAQLLLPVPACQPDPLLLSLTQLQTNISLLLMRRTPLLDLNPRCVGCFGWGSDIIYRPTTYAWLHQLG